MSCVGLEPHCDSDARVLSLTETMLNSLLHLCMLPAYGNLSLQCCTACLKYKLRCSRYANSSSYSNRSNNTSQRVVLIRLTLGNAALHSLQSDRPSPWVQREARDEG